MADDKKSLELQIKIAAQEAVATVSSLKGELKTLADEAKKFSDSDAAALKNAFQSAQASAEKAAASMKLFGASSSDLRRIQNELKTAAVELVTKGIDPQSEEVKKLVDEYKKLGKSADDLDEANGNNAGSFGDLKQAIMGTAQAAATLKTLSVIKDMGAFALTTADNFQTARNQFGILLGDMEAGAGLFNEIKAFNDKTPFDLDTLTQATNVLIAAKVPLSDLQDQLTKFGDLSQGNSQRLTSYVKAFSKASAKGKADMEILNTYLDQGVPILGALAKNFNVTEAEIVEMSSQGKISFKDFKDALDSLTAAGGQFAGGMELASQSLAAMQEGLSEAVNSLAASFGEMLLPAGINTLEMFTDLTNAVNESPVLKGFLAGALVAAGAAMTVMAVQAAALAAKTWLAQAAQMGLNASLAVTNPALWVGIAAVGAATAGFVGYAAVQQKAAKDIADAAYEQKKLNDAVKEGTGNLQNIENIEKIAKLNRQLTSLRNEAAQSSEYVLTKARELIDILEMPVDPNASSWVEGYITETEKINDAVNTLHASGFGELQGILELTNQDWVDAVAAQSSEDMLRVLKNLDGKSPRLKAEIDRIQKEIAELLKDAVAEPPSSEPDMKRSWQEWFGEIANIDPALFGGSGAKAAELFTQKFERSLSAQTTIADTIGAQLDVAEILKRRQAEVQETLTELFAIDPNDINEPFTLMNESVQRLITEYETLGKEIDNLSVKSTVRTKPRSTKFG